MLRVGLEYLIDKVIRRLTIWIARNNMRAMMKGDLSLFYHSNCKVPGIVGVMEIVEEHSVDGELYPIGKVYWY